MHVVVRVTRELALARAGVVQQHQHEVEEDCEHARQSSDLGRVERAERPQLHVRGENCAAGPRALEFCRGEWPPQRAVQLHVKNNKLMSVHERLKRFCVCVAQKPLVATPLVVPGEGRGGAEVNLLELPLPDYLEAERLRSEIAPEFSPGRDGRRAHPHVALAQATEASPPVAERDGTPECFRDWSGVVVQRQEEKVILECFLSRFVRPDTPASVDEAQPLTPCPLQPVCLPSVLVAQRKQLLELILITRYAFGEIITHPEHVRSGLIVPAPAPLEALKQCAQSLYRSLPKSLLPPPQQVLLRRQRRRQPQQVQ
mmetsp:Transcript_18449/g.43329  ORF Transcript_18449/g.43329 Transcript_18449/m.43329 type:complete len:314 (+) Transcript_18449:1163-2104(+)